jgi:branched-chain amino acid transport system ATP-binding protein
MLAIGRALMGCPRMMLMDEPSMGLAPMLVDLIFKSIVQLNREGMTILLVEQNARKALKISDRAYVLQTGAITLSGTGQQLLRDDTVREAYLG